MRPTTHAPAVTASPIDGVLKECDRLLQPTVFFGIEDLAKVQYDAVQCLLSLGPEFDAIRDKIEELQFNPIMAPLWRFVGQRIQPVTRFRDKGSFDYHVTGILNQLKDFMETARQRQQVMMSAPSLLAVSQKPVKPATARPALRLSKLKKSPKKKRRKQLTPSQFRARLVAKAIREIGIVRPQMFGESDYDRLAKEHSRYLIFRVMRDHEDLRTLLINVQAHRRFYRLAQQIVAANTGKSLNTIKIDWKKYKPREFRSRGKM